jgi:hypothetical protein
MLKKQLYIRNTLIMLRFRGLKIRAETKLKPAEAGGADRSKK